MALLTLEVGTAAPAAAAPPGCGGGDIEPMSEPIAPQCFGLSLAPAHATHNDVIVTHHAPAGPSAPSPPAGLKKDGSGGGAGALCPRFSNKKQHTRTGVG